jgi:hypothetical protein
MVNKFFSLLALAAMRVRGDDSDKPPSSMTRAFADGLHNTFDYDKGGLNSVPTRDYTIAQWNEGMLPKVCYDAATNDKRCDKGNYDVYDITYNDCDDPWTVCRCKDSDMALKDIAEQLGRIPVGVRQWIRFTQFYPGGSAFTTGQDITFFGNFNESQSVFVHEATHNLDRWVAGDDSDWYSFTDQWRSYPDTGDTCVPDDYAMSSYTENFAQVGVLVAYDANVDTVWSIGDAKRCLFAQFKRAASLIHDSWKYKPDAKCSKRIQEDDSPPTCISDDFKNQGKCDGVTYVDDKSKKLVRKREPSVERIGNKIHPDNQPRIDAMLSHMKRDHDHGHDQPMRKRDHDHDQPMKKRVPVERVGDHISDDNKEHIDAEINRMRGSAGRRRWFA